MRGQVSGTADKAVDLFLVTQLLLGYAGEVFIDNDFDSSPDKLQETFAQFVNSIDKLCNADRIRL